MNFSFAKQTPEFNGSRVLFNLNETLKVVNDSFGVNKPLYMSLHNKVLAPNEAIRVKFACQSMVDANQFYDPGYDFSEEIYYQDISSELVGQPNYNATDDMYLVLECVTTGGED